MGLFNLFRFYFAFVIISLVVFSFSFADVGGKVPVVSSSSVTRVPVGNDASYYRVENGSVGNSNARLVKPVTTPMITYRGQSSGVAEIEYKNRLTIDAKYLGTKSADVTSGVRFSKGNALRAGFRFASRVGYIPAVLQTAMIAHDVFIKDNKIYQEKSIGESYTDYNFPGTNNCSSSINCCVDKVGHLYLSVEEGRFEIWNESNPDRLALVCKVTQQLGNDIITRSVDAGFYRAVQGGDVEIIPLTVDEAMHIVAPSFFPDDSYVKEVSNDFVFVNNEDEVFLDGLESPLNFEPEITTTVDGQDVYVSQKDSWFDFYFDDKGLGFNENIKDTNYKNGNEVDSKDTVIKYPPVGGGVVPDIPNPNPNPLENFEECKDLPESCAYYDFMKEVPLDTGGDGFDFDYLSYGDLDFQKILDDNKVIVDLGVTASCPAPYMMDMGMWGSQEFKFDFICDTLENVNPVLHIASLFLALSIIVGGIRSRDN